MSYNNLGTKGIRKLAAGVASCAQLRILNVAGLYSKLYFSIIICLFIPGNELSGNDINILLSKVEVNDK